MHAWGCAQGGALGSGEDSPRRRHGRRDDGKMLEPLVPHREWRHIRLRLSIGPALVQPPIQPPKRVRKEDTTILPSCCLNNSLYP
jgi:hypothetical protein